VSPPWTARLSGRTPYPADPEGTPGFPRAAGRRYRCGQGAGRL